MRTILIGDIHGCYDEFISLLGVTKFNKKKDRLVILGDFIDKGPKSFDVLKYLSELKDEMNDNLIVLEGNHEYHFKYRGHNIFKKMILICLGRSKTKKSFKDNGHNFNYYDTFLYTKLRNYYEDTNFRACHASIKKDNIKENSKYTLVANRFSTFNSKYKGKLTITGHLGLKEPMYYPGDGSHIELDYNEEKILPKKGIICIDTNCHAGNKLTAMIIDNNKYILKYVDGVKK